MLVKLFAICDGIYCVYRTFISGIVIIVCSFYQVNNFVNEVDVSGFSATFGAAGESLGSGVWYEVAFHDETFVYVAALSTFECCFVSHILGGVV